MRAALSVIVPVLNGETQLPGCAGALYEGVQAGVIRELIVSDGGSQDNSRTLAEDLGARVIIGAPSRGGQIARGVAAAAGEWLLILDPGTQPGPGWTEKVSAQMARGRPGAFRLGFDRGGIGPRLVAGWANRRSRLLRLPFADQGLLVSAVHLARVGGYPDQPVMADIAVARRLARAGLPMELMGCVARRSFDRYAADGWVRNGARSLGLQLRYAAGADPALLARAGRDGRDRGR
ncbi:glycosyltransferase [Pseudooceanicola aestuarii]|uniref:glycosyltransferase n=1 Tax=Pseudooceanicola aestuarii TaxID=2697319 RepID=UPI0013D4FCDD|nr:glycosyltransferase [Pseudooceanicola aestuarii]